jgi:polysaccharide biosynthesis protein PslH
VKILQLSNKVPYPPLDGGSIVINNASNGLISEGCTVHLLAVDTPKRPIAAHDLPQEYRDKVHLQLVTIDTRIKVFGAFLNLFSGLPYHVSRYQSKELAIKLQELLTKNKYDIVQIEGLYLMMYLPIIRKYSSAKIVLRAQNVEHHIWMKYTQNLPFSFKKIYLQLQTNRLKSFEINACKKADGIIAITEQDREAMAQFCGKKPVISIPLGIDLDKFRIPKNQGQNELSLFHLGSMDWYPNLEAIEWFLKEIWPKIEVKIPTLKLYLAGKLMPKHIFEYRSKTVIIEGQIDNPIDFMAEKGAMIVPLRSGSGIRVKILEGMAMGKTIVSTSIGAEGIDCTNGENILIADTPNAMVNAIEFYVNNKEKCSVLGQNARKLIEDKYDNKILSKRFIEFYNQLKITC